MPKTTSLRRLIVSMNVTLDGFLSGPHCELDWHFRSWSADMAVRLAAELEKADTILMGRRTYEAMSRYWTGRGAALGCPPEDAAFIGMMNRYRKVLVTSSPPGFYWDPTIVLGGPLAAAVQAMKAGAGRDIMLYGSGRLVAGLLRLGLVDELQLYLHPVAIGQGKALFGGLDRRLALRLRERQQMGQGVLFLRYDCLRRPA